jgi:uncharacterized protein (TIGR03083 family)
VTVSDSPYLEPATLLAYLSDSGRALAAAASGGLDRPVSGCPGWDVAAVVAHTGQVHRWAAAIVQSGERQEFDNFDPPSDVVSWYTDELANLENVLRESDPQRRVWNFGPSGDHRSLWWMRRQALETAVHRWDVERAVADANAPVQALSAELAVLGIDEFLFEYLRRFLRRPIPGIEGTLHLHCVDADGEWLTDLSTTPPVTERTHAKADTALRGPASGLYLWLWNRVSRDDAGLETFGSTGVVDAWRTIQV